MSSTSLVYSFLSSSVHPATVLQRPQKRKKSFLKKIRVGSPKPRCVLPIKQGQTTQAQPLQRLGLATYTGVRKHTASKDLLFLSNAAEHIVRWKEI
jgi:hypothetical protein